MSNKYSIEVPSDLKVPKALKRVFKLLNEGYKENHIQEVFSAKLKLAEYENIVTPDIKDAGKYVGENYIVKITLDTENKARLGNSAFAHSLDEINISFPDVNTDDLVNLINLIDELIEKDLIRAYKTVDNGGVAVALCEMAILGNCGIYAHLTSYDYFNQAFNEEIAIIVEVDRIKDDDFMKVVHKYYCRDSHPFPDNPTSCVPSEHHNFSYNKFGLINKKPIIDIWWGVGSSHNIQESTDIIKEWFKN